MEVRGGSVEASMEVRGDPWSRHGPWNSVEVSMEAHEAPWRLLELHGGP